MCDEPCVAGRCRHAGLHADSWNPSEPNGTAATYPQTRQTEQLDSWPDFVQTWVTNYHLILFSLSSKFAPIFVYVWMCVQVMLILQVGPFVMNSCSCLSDAHSAGYYSGVVCEMDSLVLPCCLTEIEMTLAFEMFITCTSLKNPSDPSQPLLITLKR